MGEKGNKWKVIVPVLAVLALAFAFWYGGGGTEHGWTVSRDTPPPTPTPISTQAAVTTNLPETVTPTETPTPTPSPEPTRSPTPEPTPTGTPTPTPEATPTPTPTPTPPSEEPPAADTVTVSISCATALACLDELEEGTAALVPSDGWLLAPTEVPLLEGETAFDLLERVCRDNQIHMEFSNTPLYDSAYIEGIGNLYEFDCGEQSGWMYSVNGVFPNYGCSQYVLAAGDRVEWAYTLDLGQDIGGSLGQ